MWPRSPLIIVTLSAATVLAALYGAYRLVDPLPPRHLAIAAGAAGSGYDNFARQYARILARHGVELEIRNFAGAVENLDRLRDPASGVQAALATFGVTQPADADIFYSLGGIFDAAIFIFYRNAEPVTLFAQFRGQRLSIGMPGTALRLLMLEVLKAMREVHWGAGPFNGLGEFPAEQPNDLPLSPTAQAFYRSGTTVWQRYTSFWLTSLLNRIVFFVIPFVAVMIPVIGLALSFSRWLHTRRSERSTPGK